MLKIPNCYTQLLSANKVKPPNSKFISQVFPIHQSHYPFLQTSFSLTNCLIFAGYSEDMKLGQQFQYYLTKLFAPNSQILIQKLHSKNNFYTKKGLNQIEREIREIKLHSEG